MLQLSLEDTAFMKAITEERNVENISRKIVDKVDHPVKIMQFGEGNFLRAFVDWIVDEMNKKADFNAGVVVELDLCGEQAFSSCRKWGLLFLAVQRLRGTRV